MIEMWYGENPEDHFPKLKLIKLTNFPEQSVEFPSSILQSLPKLENLEVNGVFHEIHRKHGAKHSLEDIKMGLKNIRNFEIGECSKDRSANVLEESINVIEEEKVNGSEDGSNIQDAKDEADESENNGNDLEESNGGGR